MPPGLLETEPSPSGGATLGPDTVTPSVKRVRGAGAGGPVGGGVPGFVPCGAGVGGVPGPGGGSPGVVGVVAGTEPEPRLYETAPFGSCQRRRQPPRAARRRTAM